LEYFIHIPSLRKTLYQFLCVFVFLSYSDYFLPLYSKAKYNVSEIRPCMHCGHDMYYMAVFLIVFCFTSVTLVY
jgi:hypothetical protein